MAHRTSHIDRESKMFTAWFHTGFIQDNYLCFEKAVLDKACKDKEHYDSTFKVEIFLEKVKEGVDGAPRDFPEASFQEEKLGSFDDVGGMGGKMGGKKESFSLKKKGGRS